MAVTFPTSPAVNDTYTVPSTDVVYVWDGTKWKVNPEATIPTASLTQALFNTVGLTVDTNGNLTSTTLEKLTTLTGTTPTVDCSTGNVFDITLTGATTFTFANPPASGTVYTMSIKITQDGTGSRTVTWPTSIDWPGATAPTLTTDANGVDVFMFYTSDGGTNWQGFTAGLALG